MTPREAAKDLIRVYVLRGDSLEQLRRSGMGYGCDTAEGRLEEGEGSAMTRLLNGDWAELLADRWVCHSRPGMHAYPHLSALEGTEWRKWMPSLPPPFWGRFGPSWKARECGPYCRT